MTGIKLAIVVSYGDMYNLVFSFLNRESNKLIIDIKISMVMLSNLAACKGIYKLGINEI
jgi:hypothetical protein